MWSYGAQLVSEVAALHRDVSNNQVREIDSTMTVPSATRMPPIQASVRAHLQAFAPKNEPIKWSATILVDTQTQRNHKFKPKRRFLEIHGQVLWMGKHPTTMQVLLHLDDLTAVEPSCLEPHSLLLVTPTMFVLVVLHSEREYVRWRALLRHGRPLGYDTALHIKSLGDSPVLDTVLQPEWTLAECMEHMGLDTDKFAIHVYGTSQYWTNLSATVDEFAAPGGTLQLTAIPHAVPTPPRSASSSPPTTLNVRLHTICNLFDHLVAVRDGQRTLMDRPQASCVVRLELMEGAHVHCAVDTAPFDMAWDNSLYMDKSWYSLWNIPETLPPSWRLVCTIFVVDTQPQDDDASDERAWIKLGSTGVQVRAVDGKLVTGHCHLQLLDATADLQRGPLPLGVAHGAPSVHLECQWTDLEYVRRPSQMSLHDASILKQGTLYERSTSGGGLWSSQWTPRRCVVTSQGKVVVDTATTFSLENATLAVADKLNTTARRSVSGSKSTQKEHTTYAFTVEFANQTKATLVFGAPTRQARDDWLHTLRVAMPSSSRKSSADINWSFRGTSLSDDPDVLADDASSSLAWLLERIDRDPLFVLSSFQRALLWQHRATLPRHNFVVLPRLLACREWTHPSHADELAALLPSWAAPKHTSEYLCLLGRSLAHLTAVREFAIDRLSALDDAVLATVLPQLVQCMKWEPYAASHLVSWVVGRAVENPTVLGVPLFWALHVETYVPHYTQRFQMLLQAYLAAAGRSMRRLLQNQLDLARELQRLARDMQTLPTALDVHLRQRLCALNVQFAGRLTLPLHGACTLVQFVTSECRVLKSPKRPLWLTLETVGHDKVSVIFKAGDDVRQDMVSLQLFGLMQTLWADAGLSLHMQTYGCVATSPTSGFVEVVADAVTTAAIHKEGGVLGPLQEERFAKWLETQNPSPTDLMAALDMFRRSCAGACVATYVLGIGDRHNDNIMMTRRGVYFHIDFGHFLGHCKYHMNFKRDQTPFVFTKEMAFALGGIDSPLYQSFVGLCGLAYNELRQHLHLLTTWLVAMLPANMPELQDTHAIYHVVEALAMDLTPAQASTEFACQIHACLGHPYKRIDNTIHNLVHLLRT
ncbi:Aste57867_8213 [Aphanomyces stellatus]|uniref:Aste57867_8213 protein n=1 Tax=Aphanomyces stellatus TaxID=120398 RepID=A0A485KJP7_9STRA|nr:hypothetical protein As57867_008182 [Aphanomyces stellatus]VFT85100.1 Aste57867_8213 [Aphanomyces stellatus]